MANINFLLGAGFSVPAGYPTAYNISQKLLAYDNRYIFAHTSGFYIIRSEFYTYDENFFHKYDTGEYNGEGLGWKEGSLMLEVLMHIYRADVDDTIKNYENLYDFINDFRSYSETNTQKVLEHTKQIGTNKKDDPYWNWWLTKVDKYTNDKTKKDNWITAVGHALLCFDYLINDIILNLKSGRTFDYLDFIDFIKSKSDFTFNFFTLNHDLLLEELFTNNQLQLNDGFEVGEFYSEESPVLNHYSGRYSGSNRIYKLHGSVNYWNYYYVVNGRAINKNVVTRHTYGDAHSFYIHDKEGSQIMAEDSGLVLSGVETKKRRYAGPLVSELIPLFEVVSKTADLTIIIGYSFMDEIINRILDEAIFKNEAKSVIVIGWGNTPEFLSDRSFPNDRVSFHGEGIDNYDFTDAKKAIESLSQ